MNQKLIFPPEILCTEQRPDIVIWLMDLKKVLIIELTCPAEEGMEAARIRKETRYMDLVRQVREMGWIPRLWTIEVGAHGFVGQSFKKPICKIGTDKSCEHEIV